MDFLLFRCVSISTGPGGLSLKFTASCFILNGVTIFVYSYKWLSLCTVFWHTSKYKLYKRSICSTAQFEPSYLEYPFRIYMATAFEIRRGCGLISIKISFTIHLTHQKLANGKNTSDRYSNIPWVNLIVMLEKSYGLRIPRCGCTW